MMHHVHKIFEAVTYEQEALLCALLPLLPLLLLLLVAHNVIISFAPLALA